MTVQPPLPAAAQVGQTTDIISHIFSFLPPSSLCSALQVSRQYFHLAAPYLYHTLSIGGGSRDISVGSTRADDLGSGSPVHLESAFGKNHLFRYVKRVDVKVHAINDCPFVRNYIQPFANLDLLHLAGGEIPPEQVCTPDKCQFVNKVCVNARRVIIRSFDFTPLRSLGNLEKVTLKIRPCQLPMYYQSPDISVEAGFHSLALPRSVTELDIVWWDERHKYRLEGYTVNLRADMWQWSSPSGTRRVLDCTYCDQPGCVIHLPHAGVQLPGMMRVLGSKSPGLERVRIWNMDHTAEKQWGEHKLTMEQLEVEMKKAFEEGSLDGKAPARTAAQEQMVSFHPAGEYYLHAKGGDTMDAAEEQYWKMRLFPTPEAEALRERMKRIWPADHSRQLELWDSAEMEAYIADYEDIEQRGSLASQWE